MKQVTIPSNEVIDAGHFPPFAGEGRHKSSAVVGIQFQLFYTSSGKYTFTYYRYIILLKPYDGVHVYVHACARVCVNSGKSSLILIIRCCS